ncbi:MAG: prepilin peptidase [Rhodobacter sp.]|jgi:prepilin peptidase CpaA|nr:prepilin peptidase [Rhodobacter sp.]
MQTTAFQAFWLLIPALPIGLWIAWSDLKFMRIANKTVILLAAAFVVFGIFVFPFDEFLWRMAQMVAVLVIGFLFNYFNLVGGGDAKYAAAMAAFFARGDARLILVLFAAMLLAAFLTHRVSARLKFVRNLTPDWKSWTAGKEFPMGLALSGTLLIYLFLALFYGI